MKRQWISLVVLAGIISPAVAGAQDRQRVPAPADERVRERTMMIAPDVDRMYYFNTNRGKMGITVSIRPAVTDSIGALVDAVSPGSPAFKAGIRSGDLITRFNGRSVPLLARETRRPSTGMALVEVAASLSAGDTARVEYRRGTTRGTVSMVLEPEFEPQPEPGPWVGQGPLITDFWPARGALGAGQEPEFVFELRATAQLELAPMNPGLGPYFGVTTGVLVIRAPEGTTLNLKTGDVVTLVDGRRVSSPNQFFRVLRSYEAGEQVRFEIVRMKRRETVTASLAER
jgi:S1-C subfamily serine protease